MHEETDLPPRVKRTRGRLSWRNSPLVHGESPRQVLQNLSHDLGISKTEVELILTRVDKLRVKGCLRGWDMLGIILTAAILYVRWPKSKRAPLSFSRFVKICRRKGYRITRKQIFRCSKLFKNTRLYPIGPTAIEILNGQWKYLKKKFGFPDEIRTKAVNLLSNRQIIAGRSPQVVVASSLYLTCRMHGFRITQPELADTFGVTEVSMRNFFKHLKKQKIIEKSDFRFR